MKDIFIFEGKKYISARRASEISDYASDYVGQLCRAGKLDCRMIGRSWFVTEESIHLHKATISREEAGRSRIENLRGKSVKVTVDASVSADRSSANVPVGTGSIISTKLQGQDSVQTVSSVQAVPSVKKIVSVPVSSIKLLAPVLQVSSAVITPTPWTVEAPIKSPFTYSSDDRPLLPVLKGKKSFEKSDIRSPIIVSESSQEISINKIDSKKDLENVSSTSNPVFPKVSVTVASSESSMTALKSNSSKQSKTSATTRLATSPIARPAISASISKDTKITKTYNLKSLVTYPELARGIILKRIFAPVFAFVILFGLGTGTYIIAEKVGNSRTAVQFANSMQSSGANVSDAFAKAYSGIKSGYKSVVAFFTSPSQLAVNVPEEFGDVIVNEVTPNGIVLSPSTGSEIVDDVMKQKIRASFSDDVNISADGSGTAGVITPVFKDTNGKDFIYVMVPVKDAQDSQTK